jgi:Rrf2 family protein
MRVSAQEEFGLRCLLAIAKTPSDGITTIEEISYMEGITYPNVSKVLRPLRTGGFIKSLRGKRGGYAMAKDPADIRISDVLKALGGSVYDHNFCIRHSGGVSDACVRFNTSSCGVRELWKRVQSTVDELLDSITLEDLLQSPDEQALIRLQVPTDQRYREKLRARKGTEKLTRVGPYRTIRSFE